ncbi:MAG: hypothetical protein HYT13_03065 [Candidatus Liptonbacteria bacterium]|nr:hypothetical protein [Candidatus Liptonbacteria bacterium]
MNQKGFANIILVLVIIVLVGTIGYFALIKGPTPTVQQTSTPTKVPVTQQPTPVTPTPSNETTNWKIYRNEEYSFEMKYPSNWNVLLTTSSDKFYPIRIRFSQSSSGGEEYLDILPNGGPKFSLGPEPSTTTIKVLDRSIEVEFGQYTENEYDLISLAPFKDSELPMKWGHCAGPYDPCHGFVARISKEKDLELIQNLLSTFKFIR